MLLTRLIELIHIHWAGVEAWPVEFMTLERHPDGDWRDHGHIVPITGVKVDREYEEIVLIQEPGAQAMTAVEIQRTLEGLLERRWRYTVETQMPQGKLNEILSHVHVPILGRGKCLNRSRYLLVFVSTPKAEVRTRWPKSFQDVPFDDLCHWETEHGSGVAIDSGFRSL